MNETENKVRSSLNVRISVKILCKILSSSTESTVNFKLFFNHCLQEPSDIFLLISLITRILYVIIFFIIKNIAFLYILYAHFLL